jgi:hypothetical protein
MIWVFIKKDSFCPPLNFRAHFGSFCSTEKRRENSTGAKMSLLKYKPKITLAFFVKSGGRAGAGGCYYWSL